jgi:serine/threonine protein kinase
VSRLPSSASLSPGDIIAETYRVETHLASGGMGEVALALNVRTGERVALKVPLADAERTGSLAERFLREARTIAALSSPHVVRILDVGSLASGLPFLVLELLEGETLAVAKSSWTTPRLRVAYEIVRQACEGVAAAHGMGVVHRDLKPENLFLLGGGDATPFVKVLDFGLAKVLGEDAGLTRTTEFFGSPHYMAPEQMRSARDVDLRVDVWALGVILYELVAGVRPFEAPTLMELCASVMRKQPRPLSLVAPSVDRSVASVVMACLDKDPNERPPGVGTISSALSLSLAKTA